MNEWLQNDTRAYEPSTAATYQHVDYTNSLTITFWMCLKGTWQDWGGRWKHRTAFHAALAHFIKELGIVYAHSPQRIVYTTDHLRSATESDTSARSPMSPPPPWRQRGDSSSNRSNRSDPSGRDGQQQAQLPSGREDSGLTLHENQSTHSSHETAVSDTLGPLLEERNGEGESASQDPTTGTSTGIERHKSVLGFRAPSHGRRSSSRPREGLAARRRVGFDQKNWSMGT